MSTHIGAAPGQIAEHILYPGDPLRAEWIAQTYLDDAQCYTRVRGMLGFTGTYRSQRISVQGTGMGMPSLSIYVTELLKVRRSHADPGGVVRRDAVRPRAPRRRAGGQRLHRLGDEQGALPRDRLAPTADFGLLRTAYGVALQRGVDVRVTDRVLGRVLSGGSDPADAACGLRRPRGRDKSAALYARGRRRCPCPDDHQVSDSLITNEHTPPSGGSEASRPRQSWPSKRCMRWRP